MFPHFAFSLALRAFVFASSLACVFAAVSARAPAFANETIAREAYLVDYTTGQVLFEKDSEKRIPPASMSKIMTAYLVYHRLAENRLSIDDSFSVSENAWRKGGAKSGGSTMFLNPGERVKVFDLLQGVVVQSGNDACIVLAEGLARNERAFADEMTALGRTIGLKDSQFTNTTGWPDPDHYMTARDLAHLAIRLIRDFPAHYKVYSEREFAYNGIKQGNRNPLLYKDIGVDGVKTGHTLESGYSLTASAMRGDRRLVLVVTGLKSMNERSREAERLLEWGFREFNNYALFKAGEKVSEAEVWLGQAAKVPLVIEQELVLTLPRASRRDMKVKVAYEGPIAAPIAKGQQLATLTVALPGRAPVEIPLTAGEAVERLGLAGRLKAAFRHIVWGEAG